jgi:Protein of unknown function (DUF2505)
MPRSFDLSADFGATVEQVHSAFANEQYWRARLADSGADDATLDALHVGDDGGVTVETTQVLRSDRLPGVVTQLHRGDLHIVRKEQWTPVTGHGAGECSTAIITASIPGAPVAVTGDAALRATEANSGSRMTLKASVEVRIPLVGGKVESFIGSQLVDLLISEQRFTTDWIARHR